ncbi:MAG: hypothetical protein IPP49_20090 [Saprospiraceae bacterium]|nr:hypothetical protein [Saprospiraceae bacterium]
MRRYPCQGRDVIRTVIVSKSFDKKEVFHDLNITIERADRVAFVGQNGQVNHYGLKS